MNLWQHFRRTFREKAANGQSAAHVNESVNDESETRSHQSSLTTDALSILETSMSS